VTHIPDGLHSRCHVAVSVFRANLNLCLADYNFNLCKRLGGRGTLMTSNGWVAIVATVPPAAAEKAWIAEECALDVGCTSKAMT
jgi:hypothetical protein